MIVFPLYQIQINITTDSNSSLPLKIIFNVIIPYSYPSIHFNSNKKVILKQKLKHLLK